MHKKKLTRIKYYFFLLFFLCLTYAYGALIVVPLISQYSTENQYGDIANFHDHFEYYNVAVNNLTYKDYSISSLNVLGIGTMYLFISIIIGDIDIVEIANLVNLLAIFISALYHEKICNHMALRSSAYWLFYLNLPLIYYAQLIGKDVITIALLYVLLYAYIKDRLALLLVLGIMGAFIRIQFPLYVAFLIFIRLSGKSTLMWLFLLYILSSILGVYAMNYSGAIGDSGGLDEGVTRYVHELNEQMLIGNLLLNPVRLLQNIILFLTAPIVGLLNENLYYLLMTPMVILLVVKFPKLHRLLELKDSKLNQFIIACFFVLLIYPIVNTRYIAILVPFVLLSLSVTRSTEFRKKLN